MVVGVIFNKSFIAKNFYSYNLQISNMKNLSIELKWSLENNKLSYGKYNSGHRIKINDQILLNFGPAPEYGGNEKNLNPEQTLAAAISSCHIMTFLALAAKMKWPVKTYSDIAIAYLGKNSK